MKLRSVMKHNFSQLPNVTIPRSTFDRSHGYKTTFNAGLLVPFFVDEVLPGDTCNYRMQGFARLATPIHPIMDNMFMETHFFAVPTRLLWQNWQKFCGEQTDPGDSTDYTIPVLSGGAVVASNDTADYMGIPIGIAPDDIEINALPFRAYRLIYNEWFRDENLIDSVQMNTTDGPDTGNASGYDDPPFRRGKRHDYFTSCLPWPQKGTAIDIPLGTSAPVVPVSPQVSPRFQDQANTVIAPLDVGAASTDVQTFTGPMGGTDLYWERTGLETDLTSATAATINALREASRVQAMLERDARGGTRYIEIIKAHFGVTSPDARLQRPEFLGGGSSPVITYQVPQTSETNTTAQGNLAAYGEANLNKHGFTKSFTEHCYIIGIISVRADLTYQQGMNRLWSRQTRYDFYWPDLAHIGEQAVLNKEIYAQGNASDDAVFGYQERSAEYRYKPSQITGLFRSAATNSLDPWHLSQEFGSLPVLDQTFIEETPPMDRVLAVPSEPDFLLDTYARYICARPMPTYSVPGIARF